MAAYESAGESNEWYTPPHVLVMFTPKLKFIRPDGSVGESPGTGTCLWAAGPSAVSALRRAADRGLGILATPERRLAA